MPATDPTYTVDVTPRLEGLLPRYDFHIYAMRPAGICGPFTEQETVGSLAEVDERLSAWGFARSEDFGPLCLNGFASAPLIRVAL